MKKNSGVPKKSPRKRHKKKRLKNRKRSLRQRLARLSRTRQALAAIQPATSAGYTEAESEPEKSLPMPTQGGPLWDVMVNGIDAPHYFSTRPQLPPKSPDLVTIRLPGPPAPLMVDYVVYRQPSALWASTRALVLSTVKLCIPPLERTAKLLGLPLASLSPPLTVVMSPLPSSKHSEEPRQQPLPHDFPQLPRLHPSGRRVSVAKALKHLKPTVIAGNAASGEEYLPFDGGEESIHYEFAFRKRLQKSKCKLRQATKPLRKKAGFIRKAYRPDKKRLSRKSIGSLKRERLGLSGSSQSRRYFMKVPCLSRVSGKVLLTQSVKLLALDIKQHSELVTPVSAAELLAKQQSRLGYSPVEAHLKLGKPAVITANDAGEEQVPAGNRENSVPYEVVFIRHSRRVKQLRKTPKPFKKKSCFVKKFYRPARRQFSSKSIGSLKKQRTGLSSSHPPSRYATKTPRLSRAAGKALSTKAVKLLVPIIKQHSKLVTPVSAEKLLMRQQASLRYSPIEAPLKLGKPAVITANDAGEEQVPAGDREGRRPEPIFIKYLKKTKIKSSQATKPFRKKAYSIRKTYRPDQRRCSRKSIGALKRERPGLSGSHQPRRYATKIPRLSREAGRALLTKRAKLLAPEIKQHSEIVTPVSAAKLLMRQQASLGYFTLDSPAAAPPSVAHFPNKVPFLGPERLADNASGTEQQPFADGEERMSRQIIFRKRFEEIIETIHNRSEANSNQLTPLSATDYPAVIAAELPNAEWELDERATIDSFRERFGLPQPTSDSAWEFEGVEEFLVGLAAILPEIKQAFLDEFGGVPKEFFCVMSTEIAEYNQPGLTQQDYMVRDICREFSEEMANFNQLVQSLTASVPTELGALDPPADPPCEVVTTALLTPHPGQNHPYQQP